MTGKLRLAVGLCACALACGKSSPNPTAPSLTGLVNAEAAADGSTLKVTAPTPQSPVNGVQPMNSPTVLILTNAATKFSGAVALTYRFELFDAAGVLVETGFAGAGAGTTSFTVTATLEGDKPYQWQARAEYQGAFGPSSGRASFVAPRTTGYIRGNEIYDPLIAGKTVGVINGPVTFIPGVGVKLEDPTSYIQYVLPQTLEEGEFSLLATNLSANSPTEEPKFHLFSMREDDAEFNTNIYRMSVDVRGNGAVAWRFITGSNKSGNYIQTEGADRHSYPFHESLLYFFRATWRGNFFNVQVLEGGVNGNEIYNLGKGYGGSYQPDPHMVFLGSPNSKGGPNSYKDAVIRQVWVSPNPRPSTANQ